MQQQHVSFSCADRQEDTVPIACMHYCMHAWHALHAHAHASAKLRTRLECKTSPCSPSAGWLGVEDGSAKGVLDELLSGIWISGVGLPTRMLATAGTLEVGRVGTGTLVEVDACPSVFPPPSFRPLPFSAHLLSCL